MELLKKIFPISFKYADSVANLIVGILIYVVGAAILGAIFGLLGNAPLVGWLMKLLGSLVGTYSTAGIVIQVLAFTKVLK